MNAVNFRKWRRQVKGYLLASGAKEKGGDVKMAIILHCGGPAMLEIYDQLGLTSAQKNEPETVFDKLAEYCNPQKNEVLATYRFWHNQYREPFNSFLTELRSKAEHCNFLDQSDCMIRDKIVFSLPTRQQELLVREKDLKLDKAV